MLKLVINQADAADGCTWYRLSQYAYHSKDLCDTYFADPKDHPKVLSIAYENCDAVLLKLNPLSERIYEVLKSMKESKPYFVDLDDWHRDIDPLSNHYSYLGTDEVQLPDGSWLWKDGKNKFDLEANRKRIKIHDEIISNASLVIVSTLPLLHKVQELNKSAIVIPNAIDFDLFPPVQVVKPSNIFRIVWAGGSSHYSDLYEIMPTIKSFMEAYPNVEYHHVGQAFPSLLKDLPKDRTFSHRWLHPHGHSLRFAMLGAHVGIAPLTDRVFNTYKSSVKYYEYTGGRMATIAKNMSPYSDDILNGKTGYLYNTPDELYGLLERAMKDPVERTSITNAALDYVKRNRDIRKVAKDWAIALGDTVAIHKTKGNLLFSDPKKGKRILLTVLDFSSLSGSSLYVYDLGRKLIEKGYDVAIYSEYESPEMRNMATDAGITLFSSTVASWYEPDIIHLSHYQTGDYVTKLFPDAKVVQTVHSEVKYLREYEKPHEKAQKLITIRPEIQKMLKEVYRLESTLVYNGIDTEKYNLEGVTDSNVLLYVGNGSPLRNPSIIKANEYAQKHGMTLHVVGDGLEGLPGIHHERTKDIAPLVKSCRMTAGYLMGRTTIEGWLCGKPALIFDENNNYKLLEPPKDMDKFKLPYMVDRILEVYNSL